MQREGGVQKSMPMWYAWKSGFVQGSIMNESGDMRYKKR